MKNKIHFLLVLLFLPLFLIGQDSKEDFRMTLQKHLDAVANRDLLTLESTLAPDSTMFLILPQTEMTSKASDFLNFHRSWFTDESWTLENKIAKIEVGKDLGIAIVNSIYREPERDGKPYFNEMMVTYSLKLVDGQWYVFKDHMCSIKKSTD